MLCYKDRTFCSYYISCVHGSTCDRALTSEVRRRAREAGLDVSQFAGRPDCWKELTEENLSKYSVL